MEKYIRITEEEIENIRAEISDSFEEFGIKSNVLSHSQE